jgi:tetratricopeptide (TPR) repeat protein
MAVNTETVSISSRINNFVQKNRTILFISLASIIGVVVILITVFSIRDNAIARSFFIVDAFEERYQDLVEISGDIPPELSNVEVNALLEELAAFANQNSGYAAARAYALSAAIYESASEWAGAEAAWTGAATKAAKTYLGPIAYFNAAAAAEEQGANERAIELYTTALNYGAEFPAAPRAHFSIARIHETMGNNALALETYQALIGRWPQNQVYVNLAHSSVLALSAE